MKTSQVSKILKLGLLCGVISVVISVSIQAKEERTQKQIESETKALLSAVAKGDQLWHDPNLGSNGLTCGNCHPDGAATNPHTWPKFQTNLGKVGTLREMINWCIAAAMEGKPLPLDSADMIAMEAYATYMHRGVAIAPGRDEQHGGVPVAAGVGYVLAEKTTEKKPMATVENQPEKRKIGDLALAKENGCLACHRVDQKLVGPAWRDVSIRYKGDEKAKPFLINKVKNGGSGNWDDITGGFSMPPNYPRVSEKNITLLVDFVLSLEE